MSTNQNHSTEKLEAEHDLAISIVEPTSDEIQHMEQVKNLVFELLNKEISKDSPQSRPKPMLVGSYAKNTWLSGEADLDIFIVFQPKETNSYGVDDKTMRTHGLQIGLDALAKYSAYTRHAEHPFAEAIVDNVKINIVPCFDVSIDKLITAVDRTPHHTAFMNAELTAQQKTEVRILKRFLKDRKLYGADLEVSGFSGYACESLIHYLGTFESVLKFISISKNGTVVPLVGYLKERFPINIIDPVDKTRNLGSAISEETYSKFIYHARKYLEDPRFTYRKKRVDEHFYLTTIKLYYNNEISKDTIIGQIQRIGRSLEKQLQDFSVIQTKATTSKGFGYINILTLSLIRPHYYIKIGPSIYQEEWSTAFILKNYGLPMFINNGNICALATFEDVELRDVIDKSIAEVLQNYKGITYVGITDEKQDIDDIFLS